MEYSFIEKRKEIKAQKQLTLSLWVNILLLAIIGIMMWQGNQAMDIINNCLTI
jgi:hypothetical protein